jgi:hypothetical protein
MLEKEKKPNLRKKTNLRSSPEGGRRKKIQMSSVGSRGTAKGGKISSDTQKL